MVMVYVGVGSNIDAKRNIPRGIQALRERFGELLISPVYESEAVGFTGDNFYNLVIGFESDEAFGKITTGLYEIETRFGRNRNNGHLSSRTLDLDLLLYGDLVVQEDNLQLPRGDITEYAFVLKPLAELAGDRLHPVLKRSYCDLWSCFNRPGQKLWRIELETD